MSCSCFVGEGMLWYAVLDVCGVVGVCVALAAGVCGFVGVCVALAAGLCVFVGVYVALAAGLCVFVGVCVALAAGVCEFVGVCGVLAKVLAASVLRFLDAEVKSISRIRWKGDTNLAGVGNSQYAGTSVTDASFVILEPFSMANSTAAMWLHPSLRPVMHVQCADCTEPSSEMISHGSNGLSCILIE